MVSTNFYSLRVRYASWQSSLNIYFMSMKKSDQTILLRSKFYVVNGFDGRLWKRIVFRAT